MHCFSGKVPRRVTLTDGWPDDFRKVEIVTSPYPPGSREVKYFMFLDWP